MMSVQSLSADDKKLSPVGKEYIFPQWEVMEKSCGTGSFKFGHS